MKRLRRFISNAIAFTSALLCLVSLVLWIQTGMRDRDIIPVLFVPHYDDRIAMFRISCEGQGLRLEHYQPLAQPLREPEPGAPNWRQIIAQLPPDQRTELPLGIIVRRGAPWIRPFNHTIVGTSNELTLPYWMISLFTALWPGWRIAGALRRLKARRRRRAGACQKCGYLLTGNTSGICPECGTKVAEGPPA